MACCFRGKRLHADKETEHATTDAENAGADEDDVEVNAEDLARLSMLHLKQAFESLPSKGGQTYKSGTIMKVKYLDEDHCNYSTSGFDASERMAYRVLVPVPARGRNVGYALDVGYRWSKEDRGNSDKEEFQAHVKLLPDGPSLNVKEGGSRDSLLAIADEMPELDSSAKTKLKQIIQECTKR